MSILTHSAFWNAVMRLPTTKKMLDLSLKQCPACGRTNLAAALDQYTNPNQKGCKECGLYTRIIDFWIEFLRMTLGVKKEKVQ